MIAPHQRLIKDPQGIVRWHAAPNGTVHKGHPISCADAKCKAWGESLPILAEAEAETERYESAQS